MTILLILFAWTLILSLIVALCATARLGDLALPGSPRSGDSQNHHAGAPRGGNHRRTSAQRRQSPVRGRARGPTATPR